MLRVCTYPEMALFFQRVYFRTFEYQLNLCDEENCENSTFPFHVKHFMYSFYSFKILKCIYNKNAFQLDAYRPLITVQGGLCPGDLCPVGSLSRRSLSRGISVQGSLSRGLCPGVVSVQRVSVQGSLFRGLCPGGSLSRSSLCPGVVSVQGSLSWGCLCQEDFPVNRMTDRQV